MSVPVVDIGIVRVRVYQWLVPMPMDVRHGVRDRWFVRAVHMLVMRVVYVCVRVIKRLMRVCMLVTLRQVQPYA